MKQDDGIHLRNLKLEDVAAYLECHPERLRILLRRLAKNPSAIEYDGPYEAVAITKAVLMTADEVDNYVNGPGEIKEMVSEEIKELEAIFSRQDGRKQKPRPSTEK
jgi:hypothetical protein